MHHTDHGLLVTPERKCELPSFLSFFLFAEDGTLIVIKGPKPQKSKHFGRTDEENWREVPGQNGQTAGHVVRCRVHAKCMEQTIAMLLTVSDLQFWADLMPKLSSMAWHGGRAVIWQKSIAVDRWQHCRQCYRPHFAVYCICIMADLKYVALKDWQLLNWCKEVNGYSFMDASGQPACAQQHLIRSWFLSVVTPWFCTDGRGVEPVCCFVCDGSHPSQGIFSMQWENDQVCVLFHVQHWPHYQTASVLCHFHALPCSQPLSGMLT